MIKFMHISDLHFVKNAASYNSEEIILKEAATTFSPISIGNKFLVITGDLRDFKISDYNKARSFIEKIVNAMGIDIKQDVFVVPGNHDVGNDSMLDSLLKDDDADWKNHNEAAIVMIKDRNNFGLIMERLRAFRPYSRLMRELGVYDTTEEDYPATTHVRSWRGKLNILHLNTALIADGKNKLDQMTDINTAAASETWSSLYAETIPALAIGHNSYYDMAEVQRKDLASTFGLRNISAYLCGDQHRYLDDPEEQMIRLEEGFTINGIQIPNLVAAKGVADGDESFSDVGYCIHTWNEEDDSVVVEFRKLTRNSRIKTQSNGDKGDYKMRHHENHSEPDCTATSNNDMQTDIVKTSTETAKAKNKSNSWDAEVASIFKNALPPIVPSESEIQVYKEYVKDALENSNYKGRILILGSTQAFVDLAIEEGIGVTIADNSQDYYYAALDETGNSVLLDEGSINKYRFNALDVDKDKAILLNVDWQKMSEFDSLKGSFDVIIGDLVLGHIKPDEVKTMIESISALLKEGGYWIGKNWFEFEQKDDDKKIFEDIIELGKQNMSAEEVFCKTIYKFVLLSRNTETRMLDFLELSSHARNVFKNKQVPTQYKRYLLDKYKEYNKLQEKGISFYIHNIKDIVKDSYDSNLYLLETAYGNDSYSSDFPLLVFKKGDANHDLYDFDENRIKSYIQDKFLSSYQRAPFFEKWLEEIPSQYYVVHLCNECNVSKESYLWKFIHNKVMSDMKKEVENGLASMDENLNFVIADQKLSSENTKNANIRHEAEHIRAIKSLNDEQKDLIFENYILAVLYYLSTAFDKTESELFDRISKKLFINNRKENGRPWPPAEAPWITAKVCAAGFHSYKTKTNRELDKKFEDGIKWLISSYHKDKLHNWIVNVGSQLDTFSLCLDAILCYYNTLDYDYQMRACDEIFTDVMKTYILDDRVFETLANHPMGSFALKRIEEESLVSSPSEATVSEDIQEADAADADKTNKSDEPYQKKVLGSVVFYTVLVRIITFTQRNDYGDDKFRELIKKEDLGYCKQILLQKIKRFLACFFEKDINPIIDKINDIDTCMIPQIMCFIVIAFVDSIKSTEKNMN